MAIGDIKGVKENAGGTYDEVLLKNELLPLVGGTMTGNILMTSNKLIGGSTTTSDLFLQTTSGVGATGADMHFLVGNAGATEAMTILNDGKVGIGVTNPTIPFHVNNGSGTTPTLGSEIGLFQNNTTTAANAIFAVVSGVGTSVNTGIAGIKFGDTSSIAQGIIYYHNYEDRLHLGTSGSLANGIDIDSTGKIGIGNSLPTALLHLKAGTATANTSPIKLTTGTLNTTAEIGAIEYDNHHHLTNWKLVRYSIGGTINESFADSTVGGAESDIYTFTTIANTLGTNGDKLIASYSGNFVTVGTELTQLKAYFGGTAIWDSTGIAVATGTSSWKVTVEIIRVSATVVRYSVALNTSGASGFVYETTGELTGLTLSNTNIIKLTGTSSGVSSGSGDIVGKMYYLTFSPVA